MKKLFAILFCILMAVSMSGCSEKEVEMSTAKYDVINVTGDSVEELYLYEVGSSEKGTNYAETSIKANGTVTISFEVPTEETEEKVYILEYKVADSEPQTFETLHFEEATIYLQSLDAAAGATNIAFMEPEYSATYNFVNTTGAKVETLYVYESGSEEKGENYATEEGLAADAGVTVVKTSLATETSSKVYVIEFNVEGCEPQTFDTLHWENVTINLLSLDAAAGATNIQFGY